MTVEHFKSRDEEQIDNLKDTLVSNHNCATRLIDRHQPGMRHVKRAAIGQVNSKRLERSGLMKAADLMNCHSP